MAKSVSDQNVEDMLSSVRRLVSSELPRNQRSDSKQGASALVLTEAQRVEPKPPIQPQRGLTLEERIAELEAAVDGQSNDWEPDGSEDQNVHQPDRIVYRPSRPRDEADTQRPLRLSEIALIETGPAHDDENQDDPEPVATAGTEPPPFQRHATPETGAKDASQTNTAKPVMSPASFAGDPFADAIARDVAAVVAEMAASSVAAEKDFEAALAEAVRDPAETRGAVCRQPPEDDADHEAASDEIASEAGDVEDSDGPPEIVQESDAAEDAPVDTGARDDHQETDVQAGVLVLKDTGSELAESNDGLQTEVKVMAETLQEKSQNSADPFAEPRKETPSPTSEQLRQLVSSMIREELQGELGERITRNVRKMVRQEVHRAMSVRDLE